MTHPACGECKHCEMREKDQGKLYLSAILSSGYKYADFFRWHDCSAVYWGVYDAAVTGLTDGWCWCQRASGIPGIWDLFPTQVNTEMDIHQESSLHSLNTCKGFDWHWFYSSSSGAERHISVLTERNLNLKQVLQQFSFPNSAVQRNTDVQDGRKCVGLPLPCYWMVVSTDMLFLQDPLGSCKGNDSVIWGSSSFLEPCDSPYGHQRILVIISGQQFPFDHV